MLLVNENSKPIDVAELKKELSNLSDVETPTETELEEELGKYYDEAHQADLKSLKLESLALSAVHGGAFSFKKVGSGILKKIKDFICSILKPSSTLDEIINTILDAIASVIPGGVVIKPIIKKLIKFILQQGIGVFCPSTPAS